MTDDPAETSASDPGDTQSAPTPSPAKRIRRTMLSTGFSDLPGKTCEVCGFQGFRWQKECPEGHPLT